MICCCADNDEIITLFRQVVKVCETRESREMAEKTAVKTFGEDEYGKKLDRCLTDTLIKAGA